MSERMMTEIKLTALTAAQVRAAARVLSQCREMIPTYNNDGSIAPHWAPVVHCDGPELFTLYMPKIPATLAESVIHDVIVAYLPNQD